MSELRRSPHRCLLLGLALSWFAGASQATGFHELYRAALASDPVYAAAKSDREAADALITQTRGQLLPQLGVSLSRTKNDQTVTDTLRDRQADYDFVSKNASLSLSLAVFRPALWAGYFQSHAQVQQAEGGFRNAHQELILRLAQSYFDVLLAEDSLVLAREQKGAVTELLKLSQRYFEAGVGTITDINESQARYDTIVAQEIVSESNLEIRIRSLEQLVGYSNRELSRLGEKLTFELPNPANVDTWLEFAHNNNPQIKAREAALEVASKEVQKNISAHLPTVDFVATKSRAEDPGYTTLDTDIRNNTLGLQVAIPLFSGGSTQGRVDQSSALRRKAANELEATKRSITLAVRQEFLNVVNGVAQIKALQQAVKSNELALYSARKGQEAGLRTSFDVLNAQQLVFAAKRDLAQAKYAWFVARLKLRAAAGLLDESDVLLLEALLEPKSIGS